VQAAIPVCQNLKVTLAFVDCPSSIERYRTNCVNRVLPGEDFEIYTAFGILPSIVLRLQDTGCYDPGLTHRFYMNLFRLFFIAARTFEKQCLRFKGAVGQQFTLYNR
jgi:hypothetical protein